MMTDVTRHSVQSSTPENILAILGPGSFALDPLFQSHGPLLTFELPLQLEDGLF